MSVDRIKRYLESLPKEVRSVVEQTLKGKLSIEELELLAYERKPVGMEEFLFGKPYLGLPAHSLYPDVVDLLVEIDKKEIREGYVCAGKGSGKSTIASAILARAAYMIQSYRDPTAYFGLLPGEKLAIVNMSVSSGQAENVMFHKFGNLLEGAPCFQGRFHKKQREIIMDKGIHALSGHSGYHVYFGYNVYCGVMDECSWFQDTEDHPVSDEIYQGLMSAAKTRFDGYYKIIGISSPKAEDDFLYRKVVEAEKYGTEITRRDRQ